VRWWLAACILVLAGCGAGTPVNTEPDHSDILFAYEAGNHLHQYGGRVHRDGRYELFSTDHPGAAPEWESFAPFTSAQIDEIETKVDAAKALPQQIKGDPPPDAARATFTLDDQTVVVDDYPRASPPALEAILDTITQLRKKPPIPSTWTVWDGTRQVTLEVPCEIGEVGVLQPLRDALFLPTPKTDGAKVKLPPEGTPLVTLEYATGSTMRVSAGDEREAAVRAALAGTEWAKLPARLC
jgi:hypothetical protein